jgi:hypothetical protein
LENLIKYVVLMKIHKKISLQQFLPFSETEFRGLLHPAQANLGYFLIWFESLQLPSSLSESPLALIPFAPKSHASFEVCTQLWTEFFIFRSGLTVNGLARVYLYIRPIPKSDSIEPILTKEDVTVIPQNITHTSEILTSWESMITAWWKYTLLRRIQYVCTIRILCMVI